MNSCQFIGRLTRDADMRHLPNGTEVADFGIAINERVKRNDEWVDEPVFLDITAFGKAATFITRFFHKGSLVALECRARFEQWEDKSTGAKRSKVKFIVNRWHFTGERRDDTAPRNPDDAWANTPAPSQPARPGTHEPVSEDDIPF